MKALLIVILGILTPTVQADLIPDYVQSVVLPRFQIGPRAQVARQGIAYSEAEIEFRQDIVLPGLTEDGRGLLRRIRSEYASYPGFFTSAHRTTTCSIEANRDRRLAEDADVIIPGGERYRIRVTTQKWDREIGSYISSDTLIIVAQIQDTPSDVRISRRFEILCRRPNSSEGLDTIYEQNPFQISIRELRDAFDWNLNFFFDPNQENP